MSKIKGKSPGKCKNRNISVLKVNGKAGLEINIWKKKNHEGISVVEITTCYKVTQLFGETTACISNKGQNVKNLLQRSLSKFIEKVRTEPNQRVPFKSSYPHYRVNIVKIIHGSYKVRPSLQTGKDTVNYTKR